mmetsp:Transcript_37304/g.69666  ORF Transcript_37304/g.69666 Transcript_37304/m.69666 type:complete len:233 (-) Transcript_37304:723-1421(-)
MSQRMAMDAPAEQNVIAPQTKPKTLRVSRPLKTFIPNAPVSTAPTPRPTENVSNQRLICSISSLCRLRVSPMRLSKSSNSSICLWAANSTSSAFCRKYSKQNSQSSSRHASSGPHVRWRVPISSSSPNTPNNVSLKDLETLSIRTSLCFKDLISPSWIALISDSRFVPLDAKRLILRRSRRCTFTERSRMLASSFSVKRDNAASATANVNGTDKSSGGDTYGDRPPSCPCCP